MITTPTPTPPADCAVQPASSTRRSEGPTTASVLGGIASAIVFQVAAAFVAAISFVIVIAAAFANYGNYGAEQESTWWVIFSIPVAIAAVAIYIFSGFAASRIMRTAFGWLTLLLPALLIPLRLAPILLG